MNEWNNEQLQLKAKQLLDNWQGPLYVEMNRTEASDFPPPIKRQKRKVQKGTLQFCMHVTYLTNLIIVQIAIGNIAVGVKIMKFLMCNLC